MQPKKHTLVVRTPQSSFFSKVGAVGLGVSMNSNSLSLPVTLVGLDILTTFCCQNQLARENGQGLVMVTELQNKKTRKDFWPDALVGPKSGGAKRAEKRASSGGDAALSPPLELAPLPIGICYHNPSFVSQLFFRFEGGEKKARCLSLACLAEGR